MVIVLPVPGGAHEETALVRRLNKRLRAAGLDSASYRSLVRGVVAHDTLAHRERMHRVTLPPDAEFPFPLELPISGEGTF